MTITQLCHKNKGPELITVMDFLSEARITFLQVRFGKKIKELHGDCERSSLHTEIKIEMPVRKEINL